MWPKLKLFSSSWVAALYPRFIGNIDSHVTLRHTKVSGSLYFWNSSLSISLAVLIHSLGHKRFSKYLSLSLGWSTVYQGCNQIFHEELVRLTHYNMVNIRHICLRVILINTPASKLQRMFDSWNERFLGQISQEVINVVHCWNDIGNCGDTILREKKCCILVDLHKAKSLFNRKKDKVISWKHATNPIQSSIPCPPSHTSTTLQLCWQW